MLLPIKPQQSFNSFLTTHEINLRFNRKITRHGKMQGSYFVFVTWEPIIVSKDDERKHCGEPQIMQVMTWLFFFKSKNSGQDFINFLKASTCLKMPFVTHYLENRFYSRQTVIELLWNWWFFFLFCTDVYVYYINAFMYYILNVNVTNCFIFHILFKVLNSH